MRSLFIFLTLMLTLRYFVGCAPSNADHRPVYRAPKTKVQNKNKSFKAKTQIPEEKTQVLIDKETRLFSQLNSFYGEAWFVISKNRFGNPLTIFAYVAKALSELDSKSKDKRCGFDRKEQQGQVVLQQVDCKTRLANDLIQWKWVSATKVELNYANGAISSIVPLGVIEFKPFSPACSVEVNEQGEIQGFACKDIGQRFEQKTKSFIFEKLDYQTKEPVMVIVGKTIDIDGDLVKYESEVPSEGDIHVKLTQLRVPKEKPALPIEPVLKAEPVLTPERIAPEKVAESQEPPPATEPEGPQEGPPVEQPEEQPEEPMVESGPAPAMNEGTPDLQVR